MTYALDTNIISYLIRDDEATTRRFEQEIILDNHSYVIPPVAVFEILRWLQEYKSPPYQALAASFNALYLDVRDQALMLAPAWEKAAEIYLHLKKKGQLIEEADILVAAYCLVNDYTLVTNNSKHFSRIDGLKLVNWKE